MSAAAGRDLCDFGPGAQNLIVTSAARYTAVHAGAQQPGSRRRAGITMHRDEAFLFNFILPFKEDA